MFEMSGAIWNGNWRSSWHGDQQTLEAVTEKLDLHLALRSEKEPVIHGQDGLSQKAEGVGRASHYISLTRLAKSGEIRLAGQSFVVTGSSWMDHEFFTHQLGPKQAGWDWMSVQLQDNTELMLFNIRRKDGSVDPYSSGTYIDAGGHSTHLVKPDFLLQPNAQESWRSTQTSVHSQGHNRFRRLATTRIIGLKEANTGRVDNTKCSARIIRNGTIRDGIARVTTAWS